MEKVSYPVYRGPIIVGLIVICCFAWWWWRCPCYQTTSCSCPVAKEVVVDPDCTARPWEIGADAGDLVTWTNLHEDTLTITFVTTSPFAVDSFWIPPGHQMTLQIEEDAPDCTCAYILSHVHNGEVLTCEGGSGNPKVNVGGGGGD